MSRLRRVLTAAALAAVVSGCAGQEFTSDDRLNITAPKKHATVQAPVTVTWTMRSPEPGGSYAVFVDRTPIKVGQTLKAVVDSTDRSCKANPACPDTAYLNLHQVYVSSSPSVQIDSFSKLNSNLSHPEHTVTVVLLNAEGKRTTESAWFREFHLKSTGVS